MKTLMCVAAGLVIASAASADTITAKWSGSHGQGNSVVFNGDARNINSVTFNWTRLDSPGPGVDATIANFFKTYCVEITQNVGSSGSTHVYQVKTPIEAGYTAQQGLMLGRLWASFQPLVNSKTTSAAFQLAVWEIVLDGGFDLGSGNFKAASPAASVTLATSWLSHVTDANYDGPFMPARILTSPTKQDQFTAIPTPGSLALLTLGGLLCAARRRK